MAKTHRECKACRRATPSPARGVDERQRDGRVAISVREAGDLLGVSRSFAYELVASGELRSIRLGRRILVPLSAIDELTGPPSP